MARPSLSKGESINFFSLQTFSRLFWRVRKKLRKPCGAAAEERTVAAAGPDLEEAKKRARNFFFHWFPLVVVSGGGCGTDADAPPTLAASSKLHTLAVSGRTSNISLSRGKTSSRRWKMAQNSFFF